MSPRSREFLDAARDRLDAARAALAAGFPATAASAAYYAAFFAARAALSEEDANAKTHRGIWSLFGDVFVRTGRFDADLVSDVRRAQRLREAGDYDARPVTPDEAEHVVLVAERFVAAIEQLTSP